MHTCYGYPGYFRQPHWKSMGLLEISMVTGQLCRRCFQMHSLAENTCSVSLECIFARQKIHVLWFESHWNFFLIVHMTIRWILYVTNGHIYSVLSGLALLVLKLKQSNIHWSIPWLLMPWLLVAPGHQQQWYWLWRITRSLSFMRKYSNYPCHPSV